MRLFAPRTGHRRPISVTATAATALNRALFAFACISHGSSSCRGTGSGMAAKRWQKTADLEPAPPNVRHLHGKSLFCARHISRWQTYVFFTFPCRFSPVFPASRFPLFQLPEFRMQRNNSFAYKWISSVHLEIYPSIHLLVPSSTHCIFVYLLPSRRWLSRNLAGLSGSPTSN